MQVYLVRHTRVNVPEGICYGQSDVDVQPSFIKEASVIKNALNTVTFDAVYSSPLKRCAILSSELEYSNTIIDKRLMELNFGIWEMQQWNRLNTPEYLHWMNNYVETHCPKGESFRQLFSRIALFIQELKTHPYKKVLIFTHAGPIRCALSLVKNTPLEKAFELYTPNYGDITVINI
jgi:alpha-ribazole phosphatase